MTKDEFIKKVEDHIDKTTISYGLLAGLAIQVTNDGNIKAIGKSYFMEMEVLRTNLLKNLKQEGIKFEGIFD